MIILILLFLFLMSIAFGIYNLLNAKPMDELTITELLFTGVYSRYDDSHPGLIFYIILFPLAGIIGVSVLAFKIFHAYLGKRTLQEVLKTAKSVGKKSKEK